MKRFFVLLSDKLFVFLFVVLAILLFYTYYSNESVPDYREIPAHFDKRDMIKEDKRSCNEVHPNLTYVIVNEEHLCVRKDVLKKVEIAPYSEVEEDAYFVLSMISYIISAVESAERVRKN